MNNKQKHNLYLAVAAVPVALFCLILYFQVSSPAFGEPEFVTVKPSHYKTMRQHTGRFELRSAEVRVGYTICEIQYYWFEPPNIEPGKTYPLTVLLHGGTGYSYSGQYLTQPAYLRRYPTFIMVPMIESTASANATIWSYPTRTTNAQELVTVVSVVKSLVGNYPVDTKRIYAFGCSLGGTGVYGASAYFDDVFAAGVAISGMWDENKVSKMVTMPLYIMAGVRDTVAPVENARTVRDNLKKRGATVRYKELNMGHNCPSKHFHTPDIFDWLFAQRKP